MSRSIVSFVAITLSATLLGAWVAHSAGPVAHAAETKRDAARMCKVFKHNLDGTATYDTSDATSEIGQWVADKRTNGWTVADTDFAVSPKSNGFPQGFVHVCLSR